jgi:hypothetical protein
MFWGCGGSVGGDVVAQLVGDVVVQLAAEQRTRFFSTSPARMEKFTHNHQWFFSVSVFPSGNGKIYPIITDLARGIDSLQVKPKPKIQETRKQKKNKKI